jgi:hypothetical protein
VIITGNELIIRDTPENIVKIEELLLDQNFIDALVDESLEIANFSLIPRNLETEDPEALAASTARVVKQIETFLYAVTGIEEAEKQGRRLWYDESTLQLTIVDTSYNISRVGRFIKSLPDLRRQDLEEVIFLRHADAAELVKELVEILGIYVREARGADSSHSATRRLRRGDRFEFRGLRLQLNRVHENDPIDRDDDSVELIVTTSGGGSGVNQLREFVRMLIDEYEIVVERVDPIRPGDGNNNRPGDGTAEITVRLPGLANEPPPAARAEPTPDPEEQVGLTAIERLNAIIVQYQNPSDLDRIQELIRQLDTPTPRIDVQWVALRIDEARARSHGLDVGSWISRERPLALRPGAASEEYELWLRDLFEPSLPAAKESELRLLEAQGALSVLRGPTLTAMNERATELRLNSADPKAEPNVIVSFKPRIASSESVALSDVTVDWLVAGGADAAARRRRQVIHTPEHRLRDGEVVVLGGWSEPAAAANEGEAARPEAVYLILRASIVAP